MIFDMYVNQGMSFMGVAKSLNLREIPTKKNTFWNSSTVRGILRNCNYIGNVRYAMYETARNFEADGLHEAIISEELYNEAQVLMKKNSVCIPTKRPSERNYFSGFVYCSKCGERLKPHNYAKRLKNGGISKFPQVSFVCRKQKMNMCDAKGVTAKKVEQAVMAYFSRVEDFTVLDVVELEQKRQQVRNDAETQITALNDKLKRLDGKEREVMGLFVGGEIEFNNYRAMKKQLDNDREFIRAEIAKLQATLDESEEPSISRADIVKSFRENWENLTDVEKRQFLTKFVKKIVLVNEPIDGTNKGHTVITNIEFCGE
jgi:site-specific DNA recombinase